MKLFSKPKGALQSPEAVARYIQSQGTAEDLSDYLAVLNMEKRYCFVPRRYFIRTFFFYAFTLTLITFFCHSVFFIPMIPAHLYMYLKLRIFSMQCASFNLSGKKLMIPMAVWYVLSFLLTRFLWGRIENILP